jgi:hypothetical protein
MGFNFFGINIPTPSLPSLPRFSVPSLPRISIPRVSIPQIRLPSLPRISIPRVSIPKISIPQVRLPSLPQVNLPSVPDVSRHIESAQAAVSDLRLASMGILPTGMRVGTKAYNSWIEETAKRAQWAAEAAQEAAANVARSAPKVELPKVSLPTLPKVSLPDVSKVSLPSVPRVALPDVSKMVSLPTLPKVEMPKVSLPDISKAAGAAAGIVAGASAPAVLENALSKVSLPDISKVSLPTLPSLPQGQAPGGKNILDAVIDARDKTYEQGAENIAGGNAAVGVGQFGGAAAADVLLPLDAVNVGNKLLTGRGGELTAEDYLWAGIDAISLAAAPFTFGASYAAARAAKAAKVAAKTSKMGGEMAKSKSFMKAADALRNGRKMSSASMSPHRPVRAVAGRDVRSIDRLRVQMQNQKAAWASALRKQQDAARKQYEAVMRWRKTPQKAPLPAPSKAVNAAADALGAVAKTESKTESVWGKAGKALKYTGIGLGAGAIGLTALNALGGPAPQGEVPPVTDPYYDPYGPALPEGDLFNTPDWGMPGGGDLPWWSESDLPGAGEGIPDYGYPGDDGYYDPAYPDPLGLEDYAQDICGYAEGVPGIGGVLGAARENGMALPVLLIAVVVVVGGGVLFLKRTKTGKKMAAKVGEAVGGAKKMVVG